MYRLKFEISSFWQAGTGRGGGPLVDSLAHRDADGLPCLPGRTVKGLLRDAVLRAETWDYIEQGTTDRWFGSKAFEKDPVSGEKESRQETQAGGLRVSNAVLDKALIDYLRYLKQTEQEEFNLLCSGFFHSVAATAINHQTGSAKDKSLRSIEVIVPMTLTASVEPMQDLENNWPTELKKCLPLIQAVGTSRSRGLGRVTVTLKESKDAG